MSTLSSFIYPFLPQIANNQTEPCVHHLIEQQIFSALDEQIADLSKYKADQRSELLIRGFLFSPDTQGVT